MGLNTEISWCDHTLNLWWGCFKVSPGCKHCYADTLDNRYNHEERHWGPNSQRKLVRSWKKNLNDMRKSAVANNRRETVFVMSMGDIFEDDQPLSNNQGVNWSTINDVRNEFFKMIPDYPELIFLLLTKRPQNIRMLLPKSWIDGFHSDCPGNVWFGCSIVDQDELDLIQWLALAPGIHNKFVSMEPLLGPVVFDDHMDISGGFPLEYLSWVIVGGESGPKARPMHPDWARSLRDESLAAGTPFHFKQWGENDEHGNRVGKHMAGNLLDKFQHLDLPEPFHKPLTVTV